MLRIKQLTKKVISLLLAVAMIVTFIPEMGMKVQAASSSLTGTLTDDSIGISCTGDEQGSWILQGSEIIGQVNAKKGLLSYTKKTTTLTITNQKTTEAELSFDYDIVLNDGTVEVPEGTAVSKAGSYTTMLAANESISVKLTSNKSNTDPTTITITNLKLIAEATATVTFKTVENGTYSVNGTTIEKEYDKTQSSKEAYELAATPNAGFKFLAWYDETSGSYLSYENPVSLNFEKDSKIFPIFAEKDSAVFEVNKVPFIDLNQAVEYAQSNQETLIILRDSGSISGNYTIPNGITLLIPFDEAGTLYTEKPEATKTIEEQKVYKKLTLKSDTSIEVDGEISVGGKHYASSTKHACKPTGAYGQIHMNEGSSIVLKDGSKLFAWGYITGGGQITAKSGANVYEYFQITDWRGGTATSSMINNEQKVFPFSQYYVQNIESALTLESGANENTYVSVLMNLVVVEKIVDAEVPFVGQEGLFRISDGSKITKKYDPASDRMTFTVSGDASVESITMEIATYNINSQNYVLPINNNISFEIQSGTMTINNDVALLPGVSVTSKADSVLKIASGASLYVYDDAQWDASYLWAEGNGKISPVAYSPSGKGTRTIADAVLDVNGTLLAEGSVYTTETGADIKSSEGTGKFVQKGEAGAATETYQYNQTESKYVTVPITAAKLHNADDTYTETAGVAAGTEISYSNGKWNLNKKTYTVTWCNEDGTVLETDTGVEEGSIPKYDGELPTKEGNAQYDYTFKGWTPEINEVTTDVTYTAVYEKKVKTYKVTWVNWDGTELASEEVVYGITPAYSGSTPEKEEDAQYTYQFSGWTPEITAVTKDVTYKATYEDTKKQYTIIWKNENGTELSRETVEYGMIPEYTGATPEKEGNAEYSYVFAGWSPNVVMVTQDAEYTAVFTENKNTYTVIWKNEDGTELQRNENIPYGTTPEYIGTTPEKEGDAQYTYEFKGWTPEISEVTGDVTYTAVYESRVNQYTVTWKNWDGTELKSEEVTYGATPVWSGNNPEKTADDKYTYEFIGWEPELSKVTENVTYQAKFKEVINTYTITWVDEDGTTVLYVSEAVEYDTVPSYQAAIPEKEADEEYTYEFAGWTPEVTKATANTTYTAVYNKNPIKRYQIIFDANGGNGTMKAIIEKEGTEVLLGKNTFVRENYQFIGWNTSADGSGVSYEDNAVITELTEDMKLYAQWKIMFGLEYAGDDIYWVQDGERVLNAGLVQVKDSEGHNLYYYFAEDGKAVKNVQPGGNDYWTSKTNNLLPEWGYYFDENGVIIHDDQFQNGINKDVDGVLYYYIDGIKVHMGMFELDGNYYYAKSNGALIVGRSYYCTRNNGLKKEGTYNFDQDGKMILDVMKEGIVEENRSLYYYENGILCYAGLIQIGEDYYYVRSNGEVVHGCSYWISKTNNLLPEQSYTFAEDGKMVRGDETKKGIVIEEGSMYYYVNGVRTYAGLIEIEGSYYYVKSNGEVVHGCDYWITKTNGLLSEQSYTFAEDGKLVKSDENKNGIVAEDGTLYYYVNGVKTYAGLIEIDGSYYYVKSNGEVVHGKKYWITKTNGLLSEKSYTFAEDGKLVQ